MLMRKVKENVKVKIEKRRRMPKCYYDRRAGRRLRKLNVGQNEIVKLIPEADNKDARTGQRKTKRQIVYG